jgi:hypothetical protein
MKKKHLTWKTFAYDKEIARQRKELFPFFEPTRSTTLEACTLHGDELGSVSRICFSCFHEGWEWTNEEWKKVDPNRDDRNQTDLR